MTIYVQFIFTVSELILNLNIEINLAFLFRTPFHISS